MKEIGISEEKFRSFIWTEVQMRYRRNINDHIAKLELKDYEGNVIEKHKELINDVLYFLYQFKYEMFVRGHIIINPILETTADKDVVRLVWYSREWDYTGHDGKRVMIESEKQNKYLTIYMTDLSEPVNSFMFEWNKKKDLNWKSYELSTFIDMFDDYFTPASLITIEAPVQKGTIYTCLNKMNEHKNESKDSNIEGGNE